MSVFEVQASLFIDTTDSNTAYQHNGILEWADEPGELKGIHYFVRVYQTFFFSPGGESKKKKMI